MYDALLIELISIGAAAFEFKYRVLVYVLPAETYKIAIIVVMAVPSDINVRYIIFFQNLSHTLYLFYNKVLLFFHNLCDILNDKKLIHIYVAISYIFIIYVNKICL